MQATQATQAAQAATQTFYFELELPENICGGCNGLPINICFHLEVVPAAYKHLLLPKGCTSEKSNFRTRSVVVQP
jgi:hypothetical protein